MHAVFPYLLVRPVKAQSMSAFDLGKYTFDMANEIDKTLNISLSVKDQNSAQHVFKIEPVKTKLVSL